nr:O-antigen ligase family protein [Trueperella sp. zg.1013]
MVKVRKEFFDKIVLHYIWITIVVFTLMIISPVLSFLTKTPFYHLQSYLGIFGALLLAVDVLLQRTVFKAKYVYLLYLISFIALIATVRTREFGIKDNLFSIAWATISFSLFYSISARIEKEEFIKTMDMYIHLLFLIWSIACLVSIAQFFMDIGYTYVINPLAEDVSIARQGFLQNRLFGIFDPINHAAYISLMLFILTLYEFRKKRKFKWLYSIPAVLFVVHIILSGSRSAKFSLLICSFIGFFLLYRSHFKKVNFKRTVIALVLSACFMVGVYYSIRVYSNGLSTISSLLNTNNSKPSDKDVLDRNEDLKDNFSNNRLAIWKDYLDNYREFGVIGLSPGNYMKYIAKNQPNLYIVQYVKTNFPEKFAAGAIYHTHNGYLKVFVSTGYIGILSLLAFLLLSFKDNFLYVKRITHVQDLYVFSFLIVISGLISAIFDQGIFFMENTPAFFFWMFAGLIMNGFIPELVNAKKSV